MRVLSAITLLGSLTGLSQTAKASSTMGSGCLCTSDQPCWPLAATFSQLESQLSQPLIYPLPTASPCYPISNPSGNCTDVLTNWDDSTWRSSHPGSMESANWETFVLQNGTIEGCFMNTSVTGMCEQGGVPVIGVDVRSVEDIQVAVKFAVEYNLKLVVKNTGHDFLGRSAARGSFVVWTHNMKNITYDPAFVPQGALGNETFEAITLDAGVQWWEAYEAVHDHGRIIVGGFSGGASVGAAGGWLAGGGHSLVSPSYGLGVDNALEISVVLSTGEYLTTNEYQNSDLFWALRGGGGSTYGIVTEVTYRTYPEVPTQVWTWTGNITNSSVLPELVGGFLRYQTQFTDDGWGGFGSISNQQVTFQYGAPNMTNETVTTTTQAWLNFTQSLAPYGVASTSETYYFSSYYDILSVIISAPGSGGGEYGIFTSRLLSRDTVANHTSQVAQLLIDSEWLVSFDTVAGGKVSQFDPDSAGLNPAWRNAVIEVTYGPSWSEDTPSAEVEGMVDQLKEMVQDMYDATPNDGAYFNEASPFEVEWQQTFFGAHYSTLKSIKDKYDPYRLFVVTEGVGSDDWNKNLTCRYGS